MELQRGGNVSMGSLGGEDGVRYWRLVTRSESKSMRQMRKSLSVEFLSLSLSFLFCFWPEEYWAATLVLHSCVQSFPI